MSSHASKAAVVLERVASYAADAGVELEAIRRKRATAIYFALFTLTLLAHGKWEASVSHPSVQTRIDAVAALLGAGRNKVAEAIAHTAFAALQTLWPGAPGVGIARP